MAQLSIEVSPDPSARANMGFRYPEVPSRQLVGIPITPMKPICRCGAGTIVFTVSPALPPGLLLNSTSGEIYGIPTAPIAQQSYLVIVSTPQLGLANSSLAFEVLERVVAEASTSDDGMSTGAVAGVVTAVVAGLAGVAVALAVWLRPALFADVFATPVAAKESGLSNVAGEELALEKNRIAMESDHDHPDAKEVHPKKGQETNFVIESTAAEPEEVPASPPSYRTTLRHNSPAPAIPLGMVDFEDRTDLGNIQETIPLEEWSSDQFAQFVASLGGTAFSAYSNEARECGLTGGMVCVYETMDDLLDDLEVEDEDHRDMMVLALAPLIAASVDRGLV